MGLGDDLGDRIDGAQRIRDAGDGHELGSFAEQLVECIQVESAIVGDRDVPQRGTGPGGKLLPGDQVRVVLHDRSRISSPGWRFVSPQLRATRLIDAGGARREDDFVRVGGLDERADLFAGLLRTARCCVR